MSLRTCQFFSEHISRLTVTGTVFFVIGTFPFNVTLNFRYRKILYSTHHLCLCYVGSKSILLCHWVVSGTCIYSSVAFVRSFFLSFCPSFISKSFCIYSAFDQVQFFPICNCNIPLQRKKTKAKLSLCLTKHNAMKTYWGVEV
jgi:hypothetical protein